MGKASPILFQQSLPPASRQLLRQFQQTLFQQVCAGREFFCLITGDAELQRLNRDFLASDYPTDVLSFPTAEPASEQLGELAISLDRAREQAAEQGHSIDDEVCVLMLHGALHLLGLDHEKDRGQMKRAEVKWRAALGLGAGLIERAGVRR